MSLPHITNSEAGRNKYDIVTQNIFEVAFTLPEALREEFSQDEAIISEHVQKISGLDALHRAPGTVTQTFMGTTRTFIVPKLDSTSAELSVDLSLNLRNGVDNYIYKLFKAWSRLGYNINTGERSLKKEYCADWMKISIANPAGDIYREIIFKDIMIAGPIEGLAELDYNSSDPQQITVKFASDWWKETEL